MLVHPKGRVMLYGDSVAVLSGGLSLAAHLKHPEFFLQEANTVIGVNHNAEKVVCDWWAFNDPGTFLSCGVIGSPVIFGRHDWPMRRFENVQGRFSLWPKVFQRDVEPWIPRVADGAVPCYPDAGRPSRMSDLPLWNRYSGLSALGLAYLLRPKHVTLYGYDIAGKGGVNDEDHPNLPRARDDDRWAVERKLFDWWLGEFAKADVEVVRA